MATKSDDKGAMVPVAHIFDRKWKLFFCGHIAIGVEVVRAAKSANA